MITKGKARKAVKRWVWLVDWLGWNVTVYYVAQDEEMPDECSENATAITFCNFGYLSADIYLKLSDLDKSNIDIVVVHELSHLLISPIDGEAPQQNREYCATTISKVLVSLDRSNNKKEG